MKGFTALLRWHIIASVLAADKSQILGSGVVIRRSLAYDVDPLDLKLNPSKCRKFYSGYAIPRTPRSIYKRGNTS